MNKTQRLSKLALLLAISIILHIIEPNLPIPVYGVKLGLANIMGLVTLMMFNYKDMIYINLMRVLLSSLLRGIIFGTAFWISLTGVALSTLVVILINKNKDHSLYFLSVISAITHSIGQLLCVSYIYQSLYLVMYYAPMLLALSVPAGLLTGLLAKEALKRIK
ncbi:MAG: Gx transporter family protein [Erysipelotrichaceae bacterium]|nr:Gx transporter family protein [Erysipelotrichaceae bacterium]MDD3924238.1 Gx transporter family protein [Erysipelotrichaceae bacterium]MDD4642393.1 Gx transporter family protein [Erysipelotrichaceae bacterium]